MRILFTTFSLVSAQLSSLIDSALLLQAPDATLDLSNFASFTGVSPLGRLNNNDRKLLDAIKSVDEMDAHLRSYLPTGLVSLPCSLAEISGRINFLCSKLSEAADSATNTRKKRIHEDDEVILWASEALLTTSEGVQQGLFTLDLLYDDYVGDIGRQLGGNNNDNPANHLTSFMQYMRTIQLKGYLIWSIAIDILTGDTTKSIIPVQKFVSNTESQRTLFGKTTFYTAIGGGPLVGIRSVIYQSYIRVPENAAEGVNTQSYWDEWEKLYLEPLEGGRFLIKSKPFGTYLRANAGDGAVVEQSRDKDELGCSWKIVQLASSFTRSYFGAVSGIKTVHGTLWAEGRTRSGKSVLTTAKRVSDLTQFTISQIGSSDQANVISPSGLYLTRQVGTDALTLELEPTENSIFAIEIIDDTFFSIKTLSGNYARSSPGALGRVDAVATSVGEWTKLARVEPPNHVYHIISEFETYLQVTGPPEAEILTFQTTGGGDIEAKWEITSTWSDLPDLFQKQTP